MKRKKYPESVNCIGLPKKQPSQFEKLGDYAESLWDSTKLTNEQKAEMIRDAALRLLNGEEFAEENAPHTGGRLTAERLESDARKLVGYSAIIPRKMSRHELLESRARLTGERLEDVLEGDSEDDKDNAEQRRLDLTARKLLSGRYRW